MTERDFQRAVLDLARIFGWSGRELPDGSLEGLAYHPMLSKWSEKGWPDLALARRRDGRFLLAELKTDAGKLTARQEQVIDLLRACGLPVFVWRPADLESISEVLR